MADLLRRCSAINWNSKLSYQTPLIVVVADWRLGLTKFILMAMVVTYVLVYSLIINHRLYQASPVMGMVTFDADQPLVPSCTSKDPTQNDCDNDFRSIMELEYCMENPIRYDFPIHNCTFWDSNDVFGTSEDSAFSMTTFVQIFEQENVYEQGVDMRPRNIWHTHKQHDLFIADVERYNIMINCNAGGTLNDIVAESAKTYSKMLIPNTVRGRELCGQEKYMPTVYSCHDMNGCHEHERHWKRWKATGAPCYISPARTGIVGEEGNMIDVFQVGTLLAAAGVDLDTETYMGGGQGFGTNQSVRALGTIILMTVDFSNGLPWGGTTTSQGIEPYYTYTLQWLPETEFYRYTQYTTGVTNRFLFRHHGIRVVSVVGGQFYSFLFSAVLVECTAAMALLAVSNIVVDALMMYMPRDCCGRLVCPEHAVYRSQKFKYVTNATLQESTAIHSQDKSVLSSLHRKAERAHTNSHISKQVKVAPTPNRSKDPKITKVVEDIKHTRDNTQPKGPKTISAGGNYL